MINRARVRLSTLPVSLTSNEGTLGALAVNDLFLRTLADVPWRRLPDLVDVLAGSAFVSIVVSTLASLTGIFRLGGLLAQWLLAFALVFVLTPQIYLRTAREITEDTRFRLVTAVVTVGFALSLFPVLSLNSQLWPFRLAVFSIPFGVLLGGSLYGAYFNRVHQWNRLKPNSRVDLLNAFIPVSESDRRETVAGFRAGGWRSRFAIVVWKVALVLLCLIPCFLLGIFIDFALSLYPLLELIVLTGIVLSHWSERVPGRISLDRLTNLETRLYDSVAYAGRGVKGMSSMFLVMVGLLIPVFQFVSTFPLWVRQVTFWLGMLRTPAPFSITPTIGFIIWNQIGIFACLLLSVGFQIWFWFRMLSRLPYFLDYWERRHKIEGAYSTSGEEVADRSLPLDTHSRPLTRPVGYLLPAVLPLVLAMTFIYFNPFPVNEAISFRLHSVFAIFWPVTIGVVAVSVWLTAKRESQLIWTDTYALPISLMIQAGFISALLSISRTSVPVGLRVGSVWLAPGSFTAFVLLFIPWVFFFEDIGLFARRHRGLRRYVDAVYLLCFGGMMYLLTNFASSTTAILLSVLASACIVGGIALGLGKYFYR